MIKQKDVEKCRFFTTTGSDIWKRKKVRMITEIELENCETGSSEMCRVGEQSAERFIAINIPTITHRGKRAPARQGRGRPIKRKSGELAGGGGVNAPPSTPKPGIKPAGQGPSIRGSDKRGIKKGKKPSSQYLGVTVRQAKNGFKYEAQINRGGEFKRFGTYNEEELAAAAVQEHLGNHAEAARLRTIAEQKTDTAIKELRGQAGQARFLCYGCGAEYGKEPEQCEKCGGGTFEKVWRNES